VAGDRLPDRFDHETLHGDARNAERAFAPDRRKRVRDRRRRMAGRAVQLPAQRIRQHRHARGARRVTAAVAAGHPATVEAGVEILEAGGSAADVAVAASLASCVAETLMTGLLGGGHAIYYEAASGREPTRATRARTRSRARRR